VDWRDVRNKDRLLHNFAVRYSALRCVLQQPVRFRRRYDIDSGLKRLAGRLDRQLVSPNLSPRQTPQHY
jgi:hypothetical protein